MVAGPSSTSVPLPLQIRGHVNRVLHRCSELAHEWASNTTGPSSQYRHDQDHTTRSRRNAAQ
eukprot:3210364-Karenia_brevis.AAC.1